ncbi:MAG TPA: TolC family protein [Candidatus Limnocylindrales bacterium]|nr:TolC family protein [Candidatus Limnocylindrales bacterium]
MIRRWMLGNFILASLLPLAAPRARGQTAPPATGVMTYGTPASGTQTARPSPTQNPFAGSVPAKLEPGVLNISLANAIERGLRQNLGALLSSEDIRSARGERWTQLSKLLPNVTTKSSAVESQIDLAIFGLTLPGIPTVVGPFSYFESRAYLSQNLLNWKYINQARSASQGVKSTEYSYKNARDLVVLAVGFTYLQGIADEARIETATAQVKTAQALYDQASDQVKAGTSPAIDALRARVELQTRQQQLIQARNDFAIQKLTIARVIGLAPGQQFELADKSPYAPFWEMPLEDALKRAYASRQDFQAALADLHAAEYSRKAAVAGYYPTLSFDADYGAAGFHPSTSSHGVMDVRGTLTIPIFQGNSVHGDILKADARLAQAHEQLENLRAQIDADVRTAFFNLQSSAEQVAVAQSNVGLAEETLRQSSDRFAAGVTDTVEVVQAQEAVASAHEQYISSLYAYNYAKISLARALGLAEEGVKEFFKGK